MTHEEIKILLNDYFDEKLSLEVNTEIQVHLSECNECSQYLFSLQDLMKKVDKLPHSIKPKSDFWQDIFHSLSEIKSENIKTQEALDEEHAALELAQETEEEKKKREERIQAEKLLKWEQRKAAILEKFKIPAFKYSVIGIGTALILYLFYSIFLSGGEAWDVKKLNIADSKIAEPFGKLSENDFLETNAFTRLQIQIPEIGIINLDPDTKITRLKSNHIQLLRGSVSANKVGAKQFLTVEVPGAEISDYFLGGQSKISLTDPATTVLTVNDGWSLIKNDNSEALLLPNHSCVVSSKSGLGLPYRNGSSKEFVDAINDFCFNTPGNEETLISILTRADVTNSVTLWNLMKRVNRRQREMVIYTIFGLLGEPPLGITDDGLKTLDPVMLQKLIEEIELKI